MQQLVADGWVYEETKSELALRADQPTGTLDEPTPQGVKAHEGPQGRAFLQSRARGRMGDHLQFTAEVVGEERREQIDLITDPGTGRDIIELIVGFELGEDPLLTAPALVEGKRLAGTETLIGENDFELVAVLVGDEEVELDRFFVLLFDSGSNKEETMARLPNLRFPGGLKIGAPLSKRPPPAPPLNLLLELGEALRRGHSPYTRPPGHRGCR